MISHAPKIAGYVAAAILVLFPLVYSAGNYDFVMHLWITAFYYAILASSWALLAGYGGQFSFAHLAFMAMGAYGAGILDNYVFLTSLPTGTCTEFGIFGTNIVLLPPSGTGDAGACLTAARATWPEGATVNRFPLLLQIAFGAIVGGGAGWLIGTLVLRLRAAYLALFTVGLSEILRAVLSAEIWLTRGQAGMPMSPLFPDGITILGTSYGPAAKLPAYYVMLALFFATLALLLWVARSRIGLFLRSLREDEDAAEALGVDTVKWKRAVFVLTAAIAATAGAVQGHYVGLITPNTIVLLQMSLVIAMAVIGGLENVVAAAIGAILISFALEFLRTDFTILGFEVDMTTWRLVFFGLLLMLTLRFLRNGVIQGALMWIERRGVGAETVAKRRAVEEAK
ncbi:branched-chain amino acid ABC transporter permease [Fuscovulum ytuae]|uniref:Branched-chain amino acid ABC transporter permease n=1 Tax=Fuscovulum ytuae TaxID=3042299 RepID=A0ABY8QA10_9RHOB|nr:branched-chain amino acid ABC transporter permease [Fuscovulum sp. YMD61]WGV17321.1 branched-chain amino acid ABC transporter permease [Fuscovulum sp. YMD61]